MPINRPSSTQQGPLHYRRKPNWHSTKHDRANPLNMVTQVRLYRWTWAKSFTLTPGKDLLLRHLFAGIPSISKSRVGRTLVGCLTYEPRRQFMTKGSRVWGYRFFQAEEVRYGLEYAICEWLPFLNAMTGGRHMSEPEHFEAELDGLRHAKSIDDDGLFIRAEREIGWASRWSNDWLPALLPEITPEPIQPENLSVS